MTDRRALGERLEQAIDDYVKHTTYRPTSRQANLVDHAREAAQALRDDPPALQMAHCADCVTAVRCRRHNHCLNENIGPSAERIETPALRDDLGLSIDMLDADRLRQFAENFRTYGPDVTHWASVPFVISTLMSLATNIETAVREIGMLRSAPPEARATWQPIETAPKDGTHILVYCDRDKFPNPYVAYWTNGDPSMWLSWPAALRVRPTHFQPLPAPPSSRPAPQEQP